MARRWLALWDVVRKEKRRSPSLWQPWAWRQALLFSLGCQQPWVSVLPGG